MLYLVSALRGPLLSVLGDDDLDLEIEPTVVWSKLPEAEKVNLFGPDHGAIPLDTNRLTNNPKFKEYMDRIYDQLISFCDQVITSLTDALHSMPFVIRWLCKKITIYLAEKGMSVQEIRSALGNIVLLRFIAPAISSPEPHGIIVDTPISATARRNLGLISRILRDINRGTFNADAEPYMEPLYVRLRELGASSLNKFFDELANIDEDRHKLGYPPLSVNHRGRRRVVGLTLQEVYVLQDTLGGLGLGEDSPFTPALQRLPGVDARPATSERTALQVLVIPLAAEETIGGLLPEADIMKRVNAARDKASGAAVAGTEREGEGEGEGEGDGGDATEPERAAEAAQVDELAQKLRVSLSDMAFTAQWQHLDLAGVLEAELAGAVLLENNTMQAQLQATLRCLRKIPASAGARGGEPLLQIMLAEYKARQPYISYLVATRQSLIITRELLQKNILHLEQAITVCSKFFAMTRVRRFLEARMTDLNQFVSDFKGIDLLDEKSGFLNDTLDRM